MSERINRHVSRLNRFLPFSAEHDQIYEEYQQTDDSLTIETSALRYLQAAVAGSARIIVLTGDAGHGKTYLCRRLIETHLGYSQDDARALINSSCDGETTIPPIVSHPAKPLRIFKDFSELQIPVAASRLEAALHDDAVSIVCANEGRLRAVLQSEQAGEGCHDIFSRFEQSFLDGLGEPGSEFTRIGFRNGAEFVDICEGRLDKPSEIRLKNRLFAGLHHMQGVQKGEGPTLFLVDPAFGRSSSDAAILADKIPGHRVQLLNLTSTWTHTDEQSKWSVTNSVDWLDRHIVLRVKSSDQKADTDFHADLMMLDCLLRAASGHVPSKFYEHDLRKVSAFLGTLAQTGSKLQEITVLLDGKTQAINIDGGVIQVADA